MVIVGYRRLGTQRSDRFDKALNRPLGRPVFTKMSDKDNERCWQRMWLAFVATDLKRVLGSGAVQTDL